MSDFVGIDFGCTNSNISYDGNILYTLSSIINIHNNKIYVGGKKSTGDNIYYIKQYIGRKYSELLEEEKNNCFMNITENDDNILLNNTEPELLLSLIIKELKIKADEKLQREINNVVIAVPIYFNNLQRNAIKYSCELAGYEKIKLINEPIASGIYFSSVNKNKNKTTIVMDYGSLTFDVSIIEYDNELINVIASGGNNLLGGKNIDEKIFNYINNKYKLNEKRTNELIYKCEKIKQDLTYNEKINYNEKIILTQQEFDENIMKGELDKIKLIIDEVIIKAKITKNEIENICITGGSSRINSFQKFIKEYFSKEIDNSLIPEISVSQGASLSKNILCIDTIPFSLGTESNGGLMEVIIPKDTKIPCKYEKCFSTACDNQPSVIIHVYEGNNALCKDNLLCYTFELCGIPPMPKGVPQIQIEYSINTDGILMIKAKEKSSEIEKTIKVKLRSNEMKGINIYNILKKYDKTREEKVHKNIVARENLKEYIYEIYKTKHLLKNEEDIKEVNKRLDYINRWINDNYDNKEIVFHEKQEELVRFYHPLITKKPL